MLPPIVCTIRVVVLRPRPRCPHLLEDPRWPFPPPHFSFRFFLRSFVRTQPLLDVRGWRSIVPVLYSSRLGSPPPLPLLPCRLTGSRTLTRRDLFDPATARSWYSWFQFRIPLPVRARRPLLVRKKERKKGNPETCPRYFAPSESNARPSM